MSKSLVFVKNVRYGFEQKECSLAAPLGSFAFSGDQEKSKTLSLCSMIYSIDEAEWEVRLGMVTETH
jgi:hypothetical protein